MLKEEPKMAVVGLGALNIDHIYKLERLLDDGEGSISSAGLFPGGSAANTIYGLAKLGVSTGFCGVVGDDTGGQLLFKDFKKVGVDTSRIGVKARSPSGTTLCLSDGRQRSLYVMPGANSQLNLDDLDLSYINQARYLHLSSFADNRQFELSLKVVARLAPNVRLSFSPGSLYAARGLPALRPILARTQVLFINRGEIEKLTGEDLETGAETCLKLGCQIVAVTLGSGLRFQGKPSVAYLRDSHSQYYIKPGTAKADKVMDTTGAGDAFAAGCLYGLLENKSLEKCGQLGHVTARLSLKYPGARQGLPTRRQLESHYLKLYGRPV